MRKIVPVLGMVAVACSLHFASVPARASDTLSLGIVSLFPLGQIRDDGTATGLYPDIANLISHTSGIPITPTVLPFTRIYRSVVSGDIDLFLSFKRKSLEKDLVFLGSVGCTSMLAATRKGYEVTTIEALSGREVGFVQGSSLGKIYAEKYGVIPVYVPSNVSLVELLLRHRVNHFIINATVYNSYHQGLATDIGLPENWQESMSEPLVADVFDIQISISRKSANQNRVGDIQEAVLKARQEGGFQALFRKWGSADGGDCRGLKAQ
jgi:ABC-type amino acid transport substrate-binding protein